MMVTIQRFLQWSCRLVCLACLSMPQGMAGDAATATSAQLTAPSLIVAAGGKRMALRWTSVDNATGYTLYAAPYPAGTPVTSYDMGTNTEFRGTLPAGIAYYVAVTAYNAAGESDYSNTEHFATRERNPFENRPSGTVSIGDVRVVRSGTSNRVTTADVGREVDILVTATATADLENMPVMLGLLPKASDGGIVKLGAVMIPHLSGDGTETRARFTVRIPRKLAIAGDYTVACVFDPLAEYADCVTPEKRLTTGADITLSGANFTQTNLSIKNMRLASGLGILQARAGSDTIASVGSLPDFQATVDVMGEGSGTQDAVLSFALVDESGHTIPLQTWDSASGAYADSLTVDALADGQPRSVPADLRVSDDDVSALRTAVMSGSTTYSVVATVASATGVMEQDTPHVTEVSTPSIAAADNTFSADTRVVMGAGSATRSSGIDWSEEYGKTFTNDYFGGGATFTASMGLDSSGLTIRGVGDVSFTVLDHTITFINATATGEADLVDDTQSLTYCVTALGNTLYEDDLSTHHITYTRDWMAHKEKSYSTTIVVWIIPITLSAGACGELGLNLATDMAITEAEVSVSPFIDTEAIASAAVDVAVAEAGVRGTVTLVKDTLTFNANAALNVATSGGNTSITGSVDSSATNTISGLDGSIELYADTVLTEEWSMPLVDWDGFSNTTTLFDESASVSVPVE